MTIFAYIMSGDTSDFDGYVIATALDRLCERYQSSNVFFKVFIVVPERIACKNMESQDPMEHDPKYAAEVVAWCAKILNLLAAGPHIHHGVKFVAGGKNEKNIFPAAKQFDELTHFVKPTEAYLGTQHPDWISTSKFAELLTGDDVDHVLIDGNGSLGYLRALRVALGPEGMDIMGRKMKSSGIPMPIMAGVLAEEATKTLRVKNRDPRATMNAIYSPTGMRVLLDLAAKHDVPVLFVTNNTCNSNVRFEKWPEVLDFLGIQDPHQTSQPTTTAGASSTAGSSRTGGCSTSYCETTATSTGSSTPNSRRHFSEVEQLKHTVLRTLATNWYTQAFLCQNYVLYDWLCFGAMVYHLDCKFLDPPPAADSCVIDDRYLYVGGATCPDVLVLRTSDSEAMTDIEQVNLADTQLFGRVKFLVSMDRGELMRISRQLV